MRRTLLLLAAAIFAGCLFPSFDDLGGTGKKKNGTSGGTSGTSAGDDDDDDDVTSSSGNTTSSSGTSGTSSSGDGGRDPSSPGVVCGAEHCLATEFCCLSVGGTTPDCQPAGAVETCAAQLGGKALTCDGDEDCAGQICCGKDDEASCAPTCDGQVLCNAPASKCPDGKSCTGKFGDYKACQ